MRKLNGFRIALLAFAATGAVIVVPSIVTPAAARDNGASAAFAAPAPLLVAPLVTGTPAS